MLLAEVVSTSSLVAKTRSRKEKVSALAEALRRSDPSEIEVVLSYLSGALRQRRTGLGWRGLAQLPAPAAAPGLSVLNVHDAFEAISELSGPGSQHLRQEAVRDLFGAATAAEQEWLRAVATGNVRQGALDALTQEALAEVAEVPLPALRRAAMLAGSTVAVAGAALDGIETLKQIRLEVGRPIQPMLAASAPSLDAALDSFAQEVAIDAKLDGIRIQVHRDGAEVLVVTRTLDDITTRMPEVVATMRQFPAERFVLDGEVLSLDADGRPAAFQDTASRAAQAQGVALQPYFFDILHLDGHDLLDTSARDRFAVLASLVPATHRVARIQTDDPGIAASFTEAVLAAGHEGVVVKDLNAPYAAGRRGASWVKVKPVHTLDLVVLAVEWGSGRREGWLSNIHLGVRDSSAPTGFTMLGKTFKGMTDEMLIWQTERFLALETHREGHVVQVHPVQVVEVAFDGIQRSKRYPGGVMLRFARVVRYREDKSPDEIATLAEVRAMGQPVSM